jgi:Domain of unknown function (DUF4252)
MRTLNTKLWPYIFLQAALVCALSLSGLAQNARLELKNLEKLNSKASEVNEITLDSDMLQMAGKFLDMDHDADAKEVKEMIKGLKGIYIKNFEFDAPNEYSAADVDAIRTQLAAPGWSKVVESRSKHQSETNEIYIMKVGDKVAGVAILVAEPKELTVVNIVGLIDIEKLGELEGHFGIPGDQGSHRGRMSKPDDTKRPSASPSPDKKEDDDDQN